MEGREARAALISLRGNRIYTQSLPRALPGLRSQLEKFVLAAGQRFFGNRLPARSVLQPNVQPETVFFFTRQQGVGTKDHNICAWVRSQPFERGFGQSVFISQRQLAFGAGHVFSRHQSETTTRGQFRAQHFGKRGREPIVVRTPCQVAESQYRHGAAGPRGGA